MHLRDLVSPQQIRRLHLRLCHRHVIAIQQSACEVRNVEIYNTSYRIVSHEARNTVI